MPTFQDGRNAGQIGARHASITVAASKTPERIAQEIARRLLPNHEAIDRKARARIKRQEDYEAAWRTTITRIAAVVGDTDQDNLTATYLKHNLLGCPIDGTSTAEDVRCTVTGPDSLDITISLRHRRLEELEQALRGILAAVSRQKNQGGEHHE